MQLPEFARSTTLRWTLVVASIFAAFVVALLGFVYLKTRNDLIIRSDRMSASQMRLFAHLSPERRFDAIDEDLKQDPRRVRLTALFGSDGRRIAGNLEHLPPDLKVDDAVQTAVVDRADESGREQQAVRLIARIRTHLFLIEAGLWAIIGGRDALLRPIPRCDADIRSA